MKQQKRGKKAQFFIIGAVILGIIILSITTTWNIIIKGTEETAKKQFDLWCENYEYETFKISEHAIKTNNKRILGIILAANCSVSKEAGKTILAINEQSPIIAQRLVNIAKYALDEVELSSDDRTTVEGWREEK